MSWRARDAKKMRRAFRRIEKAEVKRQRHRQALELLWIEVTRITSRAIRGIRFGDRDGEELAEYLSPDFKIGETVRFKMPSFQYKPLDSPQ